MSAARNATPPTVNPIIFPVCALIALDRSAAAVGVATEMVLLCDSEVGIDCETGEEGVLVTVVVSVALEEEEEDEKRESVVMLDEVLEGGATDGEDDVESEAGVADEMIDCVNVKTSR
ncbi:hypothetical protein C0993_008873, partial [Termitomyces sp. T159_Od127]